MFAKLLATFTLIFSLLFQTVGVRPAKHAEEIRLKAVLVSDIHSDADFKRDRTDGMRQIFAAIGRTQNDADTLVMSGDLTNSGDLREYINLINCLNLYCRIRDRVPEMGNHDSWHHSDDPDYAKELGVTPPKGFVPKAVALNSGLYRLVRGEEDLLDSLAEAYFAEGGTDREYTEIELKRYVNTDFPPTFVMTAPGDFLNIQAKPFYDFLQEKGVKSEYHSYGDSDNPLNHVFHINIKLAEARKCNEDECAFFLRQVERGQK